VWAFATLGDRSYPVLQSVLYNWMCGLLQHWVTEVIHGMKYSTLFQVSLKTKAVDTKENV
jgi:hypothetical protein